MALFFVGWFHYIYCNPIRNMFFCWVEKGQILWNDSLLVKFWVFHRKGTSRYLRGKAEKKDFVVGLDHWPLWVSVSNYFCK